MILVTGAAGLGAGKRLFEDIAQQVRLELVKSGAFSTGVLFAHYEPADKESGG